MPRTLIGVLIAAGLALIVIGLIRSGDDGGESTAPVTSEPQTVPAPVAEPEPEPETPAPVQEDEVALDTQAFEGRFEIGVPAGWERGREDGGVTIEADGGDTQIKVFFEEGERSNGELARAAAGFLADEYRGAQVGAPRGIRLGGYRASRVRATYRGGEAVAVVLSADGFAFLIVEEVERGASAQTEQEADAAVESFRAL